jgi:hypothetical protein
MTLFVDIYEIKKNINILIKEKIKNSDLIDKELIDWSIQKNTELNKTIEDLIKLCEDLEN